MNKLDSKYELLTPFKLCVIENFPFIEADFDAITNYQLMCKIIEYLNKDIERINSFNNDLNRFNEYFDNLDVQEEINKKLDSMAISGELTTLIQRYIDPLYSGYENRINQEVSTIQSNVNRINSKVDTLSSGAPIPVSSISNMTDITKAYVLTTTGHWFFYNNGQWNDGGVYQASTNIDNVSASFNDIEWIDGEYYNTSNIIGTNNAWTRTKYIYPIDSISEISVVAHSGANIVSFYNASGDYIGALTGTDTITNLDNAPDNAKYISISYIKSDPLTLKFNNLINNYNDINISTNNTLEVNNITNTVYAGLSGGIKPDGTIWYVGGWFHSDYIKIDKSYNHLLFKIECYQVGSDIISPIQFYDNEYNLIKNYSPENCTINKEVGSRGNRYCIDNIIIPENSEYIRISSPSNRRNKLQLVFNNIQTPFVDDLFVDGISIKSLLNNHESNWNNKTCAFLGDSITAGIGTSTTYFQYLHNLLNIDAHGYGQNGAKMRDLLSQAQLMNNELVQNIDAIFVFAGTNDFNSSTPIGEWFTTTTENVIINRTTGQTQERQKRNLNTNTNTFKGSITSVLNYLKTNYPTKQIILITPIHRGYAEFGDTNIQYDESYSNSIGLFINDYVDAINEASEIFSVPVIDLFSDSGLYPLKSEYDEYFNNSSTDKLHPNALGHQRIAQTIAKNMNHISSTLIVQ